MAEQSCLALQLMRVQEKMVDVLAPHVPEYMSNTTELQRKLGFELPSLFSEDEGGDSLTPVRYSGLFATCLRCSACRV